MSINLIRTESYYEPEGINEEDPNYYQRQEEATYDNKQEPENYQDDKDGAAVDDVETGNIEEEEETEVKDVNEAKGVNKKLRAIAHKKPQSPLQVNLDQLVEKVRERLLGDVNSQKANELIQLKQKVKKTRMVAQGGLRQRPLKGAQALNNKKAGRIRSEVVEEHDLYEKTALQKSKKDKKDSYEDYITPKKDENAFISVEEEDPTSPAIQEKVGGSLHLHAKQFKGVKQAQGGQGTRGGGSGGRGPGQKRIVKNVLPRRKKKTTYVAPEYYDDTPPPTTPQLKVRTEVLGQIDYKDLSAESLAKLKAKDATAKTKKAKIVTNMQTRAKFSFSSPNYYAKLPRIAEKYNFDEPIPQKDQEEEKLKEIVNDPDVLINKKMQVNPQPTIPIQAQS